MVFVAIAQKIFSDFSLYKNDQKGKTILFLILKNIIHLILTIQMYWLFIL